MLALTILLAQVWCTREPVLNEYAGDTLIKSLLSLFSQQMGLPRWEKMEPRSARNAAQARIVRRPHPTQPSRLMAQTKLRDQRAIAFRAFFAQISQEPTPPTNQQHQSSLRMHVVFMHFEMLGKLTYPTG